MEIYYKEQNDDFSSKQSFEEKSRSYILTMKFLEMKTYFDPPSSLLALLDILKTKICDTLDLMTEMTLCPPKDQRLIVIDYKMILMNFDEQT